MAILSRKSKNNGFSFMIAVLLLLFLLLQGQLYAVEAETQQKNSTDYPATPEEVVEAFVRAGFDVATTGKMLNIGDVEEQFQYYKEHYPSGYDCFPIALSYKITKLKEDTNEARVKVAYEYIGDICAEVLHMDKKTKKEVIYRLDKSKKIWKIYFPTEPPYISVKTAIKLSEDLIKVHPKLKKKIERNISIFKKYYKESSN